MLRSPTSFMYMKGIHAVFLVAILATFRLPALPDLTMQRIEPSLRQQISKFPTSEVNVIIQKQNANQSTEQYVTLLGGEVTQNLSIINAFAATLPASRIPQIAQHPGVRWISPDAPIEETECTNCISVTRLKNEYDTAVFADQLWNKPPYLQGQGITVAVVDSGIASSHPDFSGRVIATKNTTRLQLPNDNFGHGTYVAGIIAGNGAASKGAHIGIAPKAQLLNVKVSESFGASFESDLVEGLQWIYENRKTYNIKVVNISLTDSLAQSYHTSPIAAACEVLWFNGIVVVVSSGNKGHDAVYPPANDPFVITVGAADSQGTASISDDVVASFSAHGKTSDGFSKPDLIAPGRHIVGPLAGPYAQLAILHPANVVNKYYMLMSGTSAAAPMVSGAAALLLQDEPKLTPDQVKYRLMETANKKWAGFNSATAGAGYLDILAAVNGNTTKSANTGTTISNLLTTGPSGVPVTALNWTSVNWASVNWASVNWASVNWASVNWASISWNSDYWESAGVIKQTIESRSLSVDIEKETSDTLGTPPDTSLSDTATGVVTEAVTAPPTDTTEQEAVGSKVFLPIISSNSQ